MERIHDVDVSWLHHSKKGEPAIVTAPGEQARYE